MIIASFIITGLYVLLMLFLRKGIYTLKPFVLESLPNKTQFSIIVPFRDEAQNLENLLQSFVDLDYPKDQFEIILVNDFSSDNYKSIIEKFKEALLNLRCIDAEVSDISPKKAALSLGILKAKYDWIVTTDADCQVPKNWLKAYTQKIVINQPLLIAGLVKFSKSKTFLDRFQCLDLLSLQATLLGTFGQHKPILCHGANLCFSKQLFYELNGYKTHQYIASGDDVFLLEAALKKYPDKVTVLNSLEATVSTQTESTFKKLLSQRTRWAAKASAYKNTPIKIVGLIVFAMNLLLIVLGVLSFFKFFSIQLFGLIFLLKFNIDALILYSTARYFKQESVLKSYILSSFLYPLFSVTSVLLGMTNGFTWKDRKFKK
jgi:poly-beta-1,6-N-acetyl-D-glucosamine synthase